MSSVKVYDVVIVGGGWSGLLMCKYALEYGLEPIVVEKRSNIGGVWNFTENTSILTVQESTCSTSSSSLTEMSDFPMPPEMGNFPHHTAIENYLKMYATHFKLWERIIFNTSVEKITKTEGKWEITTSNSVYQALNVSVCSGALGIPYRDLEVGILKEYKGTIIHGGEIKRFDESYKDKTIVIVGGGETAADILEEWYPNVKQIFWSIPRGQHFFRKYAKILPHREPQVLDKASSRAMNIIAPFYQAKPGLSWICHWTTNGSLLAYQGHGIKEFRNEFDFMHSPVNKNGHVLDFIDYKKVVPKSHITGCDDKIIFFEDNNYCEADLIIICTGYHVNHPFLPEEYKYEVIRDMYKHILHPNDTTLSFIGHIRPIVGSIPQLAEMQSRFASMVWSGRIKLGSKEELKQEIEEQKLEYKEFVQSDDPRKQSFVEGYCYLDDMARITGTFPNYRDLLNSSLRDWYIAVFAPFNGAQYRLNNQSERSQALATMERHMQGSIGLTQFTLIIMFRLIKFDLILKLLGKVKYSLQASKRFASVRNSNILNMLNSVWLIPKKLLFDQRTRASKIKFEEEAYRVIS